MDDHRPSYCKYRICSMYFARRGAFFLLSCKVDGYGRSHYWRGIEADGGGAITFLA